VSAERNPGVPETPAGGPGTDGLGDARLRLITDAVPVLISYVDSGMRYQFNNRQYEEWFGQRPEWLLGRHMREVLGEAAFERIRPHAEAALAGQTVEYEAELPYKHGGTRIVRAHYVPDRRPDGSVAGYYALVHDMTAARQAEQRERALAQEVNAESERYRSLFESLDEAFCVLELIFADDGTAIDFRYLEVNPAFEQQTGLTDAVGRRATEVLEHEAHWFDTYGRVARTGEPVRFQNRAQALGRWFDVYAFRMGAPQDARVALLFRDITATKQAEESIRFQARLLDEVGQAVVVSDPDGRIIYWNRAAEDLYGWTREEALGRSVLEITDDADGSARAAAILQQVSAGRPWSGEVDVRSRAGVRSAIVTNTPLFDEQGALTAIVGVAVDISQLKTVQRALQDADRRKDEFLATLAHELRNPLAAIRMALGVLARGGHDPGRVHGIIERQSAQLVRLIDDLLDVSRITRGKVELHRHPVSVAQILEHAVDAIAPMCESRGLRLTVHPPDRTLVVHADPLRFAQVVSNLLNNACKFTPPGGEIVLSAAGDGDQAVVTVRDTGMGIPDGELERVFDMFAQVGGPHGHGSGGLGIGLSLARSIVAMHGGTIRASSDGPGRGSTFVVRLPVLADAVVPPPAAAPQAEPLQRGGTVLAVDDNRDALDAVAMMLRTAGYTVVTAGDGIEGLERARQVQPGTVLLDIGLPGLDGYEVARRIRREPWGRSARLVAMTGWGQEKDKQRAHEAGFDAHLTKPVDPSDLVRVLAERRDTGKDRSSAAQPAG
jgi:PAS domain S-box-containing protein